MKQAKRHQSLRFGMPERESTSCHSALGKNSCFKGQVNVRPDRKLCHRVSRWTKHPFWSREDNAPSLAADGNHLFKQLQAHLFCTTDVQFSTNQSNITIRFSPISSCVSLLCSLQGSGWQISLVTPQFNDVCSWQQSTEELEGAVSIPGGL